MKLTSLIQGLAIGAGAMYVLDPQSGRRRQAMLRDKAIHTMNAKQRALNVMQRDFQNRARGVVHSIQGKVQADQADDVLLEHRIRSAMGRFTSHAGSIQVSCSSGDATLTGCVLASEVQDLIRCVQHVKGVSSVINNLDMHDCAEGVSGLQGGCSRAQSARLTPAECLVLVGGGAMLSLYGLMRRGTIGLLSGMAGSVLMFKGFNDTEHRFDSTSKSSARPSKSANANIVQQSIAEFGGSAEAGMQQSGTQFGGTEEA